MRRSPFPHVLALASIFSVLICSQAHAEWRIEYVNTGTTATDGRGSETGYVDSSTGAVAVTSIVVPYRNPGSTIWRLSGTVNAKAKVSVYAVWQVEEQEKGGRTSTQLIPKKILVKEWCRATALADWSYKGSGGCSASLAFGSISPIEDRYTHGSKSGKTQYGEATQWTTKDNSAGATRVLIGERTITADANVTADTEYSSGCSAQASAMYRADIYNYPEITSSQIESSYEKGRDGKPKLIVNDDPSTKRVVSGVEYYYNSWVGSREYYVSAPFSDPVCIWSLSGEGNLAQGHTFNSNGNHVFGSIELGAVQNGGASSTFGKTSKIKAGVTASIESSTFVTNYAIEWHYPVENLQVLRTRQIWDTPRQYQVKTTARAGGSGTAVWQLSTPVYRTDITEGWEAAIDSIAAPMISIVSGFKFVEASQLSTYNWLIQSLIKGAGPVVFDSPQSGIASFNDMWAEPDSTFNPAPNSATSALPKEAYIMTPYLWVGQNVKLWKGDGYDSHGYTGAQRGMTSQYNGLEKWVGEFRLDPTFIPPGDPRGGAAR